MPRPLIYDYRLELLYFHPSSGNNVDKRLTNDNVQ